MATVGKQQTWREARQQVKRRHESEKCGDTWDFERGKIAHLAMHLRITNKAVLL